jgi:multisubunit Na+/H+ antiporter MnhB subunit
MDSVLGNRERKNNRALDLLLLIGVGVVVCSVGIAAFWIADNCNIACNNSNLEVATLSA